MDDAAIHILIVDDEEAHSLLIRRAFQKRGNNAKLTIVENLAQAREFLSAVTPHLVIADWLLPDGRGTDLLTKEPEKLPYPVMVITSHGDEQMAVDIIKAGAQDFIIKSQLTLTEMPWLADRVFYQWRKVLEHRRAQAALRENEERLKVLFDCAPDGIVLTDLEGAVIDINRAALAVVGLEKKDVIGRKFFDLDCLDPEQLPALTEMMRHSGALPAPEPMQFRVRAPAGQWRTLESTAFPIHDKGGILIMSMLRDITQRKRAEQDLAHERNRLRTVIDNIPDAVALKNVDGVFVTANIAAAVLLGADSPESLIGQTDYDIYPPAEADIYSAEEKAILKTGIPVIDKEGSYLAGTRQKWILTNKIPLTDADGKITGIVTLHRDITERKLAARKLQLAYDQLEDRVRERTAQLSEINRTLNIEISERQLAEEALRHSQKRQKAILDTIPDIAWLKDTEGRYIAVNEPFAQTCGLSADDLVGKSDFDIWPEELAQKYRADDSEVISTGVRKWLQEPFSDKTKKRSWVETIKTPIYNSKGDIVGTSGIARDVTLRKKMEEKLRESEKLAVAGKLAAKVAHEINNPLAGIKNSFLLIKDAIPADHPYYEYVPRIDKEISRVTAIVRQMFDLYRPDSPSPTLFRVSDVINDVVAMLNVSQKNAQVAIDVRVSDPCAAVMLPEGMFRQVLYNIIGNAIEASSPGQSVKVAANISENLLTVTVADSGSGIPEEIQQRLFEPFFTTKTGHPASGLGLGLSVSKSEVETMGGTISFESFPGTGACFTIKIPFNNPSEKKNASNLSHPHCR